MSCLIFSSDEQLTSYVEFKVQKSTPRQFSPVKRLLCLSSTCIIERDPATYAAICARSLKTVCSVFLKWKRGVMFSINGEVSLKVVDFVICFTFYNHSCLF